MTEQLHKSKRQDLISKKRYPPLSEIVEELEETMKRLDYHEQRLYRLQMQETTVFDVEYEGAMQQPT